MWEAVTQSMIIDMDRHDSVTGIYAYVTETNGQGDKVLLGDDTVVSRWKLQLPSSVHTPSSSGNKQDRKRQNHNSLRKERERGGIAATMQ